MLKVFGIHRLYPLQRDPCSGIEANGINLLLALTIVGIVQQSRLETEIPWASSGPPSGGRAASLTPLYSTGPYCPV